MPRPSKRLSGYFAGEMRRRSIACPSDPCIARIPVTYGVKTNVILPRLKDTPMSAANATVLILTPMKSASSHLDTYFNGLETLTYPHSLISLGILEGDSGDDTFAQLQRRLPE